MQCEPFSPRAAKIGFKVIILLGHTAASIALAVLLLRDRRCDMVKGQYWETGDGVQGSTAQLHHNVWPVMVATEESAYAYNASGSKIREDNCTSGRCVFSDIPPSVLVQYSADNDYAIGGANNIVFLMTLFEWITVGFAIVSLLHATTKDNSDVRLIQAIWGSVLVWNVIGVCVWCATARTIPLNNTWIGIVLGIAGTLFQLWPLKPQNLIPLRYIEYAITAPVLLIAVQGVTMGANGWAMYSAFTCMMVTNLLGVSLHKHAVLATPIIPKDDHDGSSEVFIPKIETITMNEDERWMQQVNVYICLFTSWVAFLASWIGYFSQVAEVFANIPDNIKIMVVALPIAFSLFGVVGTIGTLMMNGYNTETKIAIMDALYDVLSIVIKLMVVGLVTAGDLIRPTPAC